MGQDSDKTEEPTEHKLQEARKKGQVMKSQDVISTVGLIAAVGVIMATAPMMYDLISSYTVEVWSLIPDVMKGQRRFLPDVIWTMLRVVSVLAPLLAAVFLAGILSNVAQIQFLFTFETMKPSLNKINPIEGFKKIFSVKSVVELLKQIAKLTIVGWICYTSVRDALGQFQGGPVFGLEATLTLVGDTVNSIVKKVIVGMICIAGVDYAFQKQQFTKQQRMSHKDLKDEYKETEGNPEVKGKLRQKMREASQGRSMGEVADASAVVTNPTHLAVAIKYDKDTHPVPTVVAKGERLNAQKIKLLAEDNDVPVLENVELARALFGACEVGQVIPSELYKSVAEVLAYIIKLKRKKQLRLLQRRNRGPQGAPPMSGVS